MATIEANEQEIGALRQLIHRATLHSGMEVAEAALFWDRKLQQAMQQRPEPPQMPQALRDRMAAAAANGRAKDAEPPPLAPS